MNYTDKEIEQLLSGIYNGTITEYNIPNSLYRAIADHLRNGVYEGFGATLKTVSGVDLEMLTELRTNVYMFGAAKSFQELREISSLLVGEDGKLISRSKFNQLGREKYDLWNNDWGNTEYNTAVGQAQMAAQWQEIERTKGVVPYLRYSAIIDPNTSTICRPLDGIIAKVDDKIWDKITPLNHFNCRCTLIQEYEGTPTVGRAKTAREVEAKMQDVFVNNAGKTGEIFTKDHPYFDVPAKDKEFARQNFNLKIPQHD